MRKLKFFILLTAIALINCERDDICAESTATTPRLLIEFYDAASTEDLKSVTRLTIYGEDLVTDETGMVIEPIEDSDATILFNENANAASLPLRIGAEADQTIARFVLEKSTNLRLDTNATTVSNVDIIEIRYNTEFIYVSRACGYKSIFNNLNVTREVDSNNWISSIQLVEPTVENENTIHVRIFH